MVFAFAAVVFVLSAEPTGSLWDCGEFISASYKLQVVHPPGAPLYLMIGRVFTMVATTFSDNPENIAYAVNVLSGICTAFMVLFLFWTTTLFGKFILVGRDGETNMAQNIVLMGSGIVGALCAGFGTSIWFSAVEGEVYAMSAFFTGLLTWAMMRWYAADDSKYSDRWLIFIAFMMGLSSTVHLLSLLMFPFLTIMYYLKKYPTHTTKGFIAAAGVGVVYLGIFQYFFLPVIPTWAAHFDRFFVNNLGLPFGFGIMFFVLAFFGGLTYMSYRTYVQGKAMMHNLFLSHLLIFLGFSTYAMIIIRAEANTPINMNNPNNAYSWVSYLKREQYGDRPLFYGPHYEAQRAGTVEKGKVWRPVGDEYAIVDTKIEATYRPEDYIFLPRLGHLDRGDMYRAWLNLNPGETPTSIDNFKFLMDYQIGWMYVRYLLWNYVGRQNGDQGYFRADPTQGNWLSGIKMVDNRLYNQDKITSDMAKDPARNTYYFIPLIFGLIGLFFHFARRPFEASAVMVLFLMTGLAIIFYANEPPMEPRERDYTFAGSFAVFGIWIGLGVTALYSLLSKVNFSGVAAAALVSIAGISAPYLLLSENWDDHSRADHYGARDYASNFLNSVDSNAIMFSYGDNDTYPVWYAQEVEKVREDVRVVNFSLLAVDWYINQQRRKINNSPAVAMSIPADGYTGELRNYLPCDSKSTAVMSVQDVIKFMGEDHTIQQFPSYIPTRNVFIPVDKEACRKNGIVPANTPDSLMLDRIVFQLPEQGMTKDEIALLDIIATNAWKRPVYWAVTCRPEKFIGLSPYLRLEGLALQLVPFRTQPDGRFSVSGYGFVDTVKTYDRLMNDFKWGNFDKKPLYINKNYAPSVQTMQMAFIRLAETFLRSGNKVRAAEVIEKYFSSFPNFNFPYVKNNAMSMIQMLDQAAGTEKAKPHILIMAKSLAEYMTFFESLSGKAEYTEWLMARQSQNPMQINTAEGKFRTKELYHFKDDYQRYTSYMYELNKMAEDDAALKAELKTLFDPFIGAPGTE